MKICSIYNVFDKDKRAIAYLVYYDKNKNFYIEIDSAAKTSNMPMMFALFAEKGEYSIDSMWSKKWVCSRIIPPDRQNLGQIMRANNIKFYDEYEFLIRSKGICSHDDFCVEEIPVNRVDETILTERFSKHIKDMVVLDREILIFFEDDITIKYDIAQLTEKPELQKYIYSNIDECRIMPGGFEINWNDIVCIHVDELRKNGQKVDVPFQYFERFAKQNLVNTSEVCETLNCSRQNVDDMVKRKRLKPVQTSAKNKVFLKRDIEEKLWR